MKQSILMAGWLAGLSMRSRATTTDGLFHPKLRIMQVSCMCKKFLRNEQKSPKGKPA
jgi:hypothetical protein